MPRAIWSGSISFGLVNIPVELQRADRRSDLSFELVDSRNQARVRYQRVNEETGEEVPWGSIVKGYEFQDGNYVLLTDEDFKEVAVKATRTIEIEAFVEKDAIDVAYYDRPYYLVPGKKGEKGYVLLREALERSGKVGIAKVVIRTREYLCAMMPHKDALMLMLLRFHQELLGEEEFNFPDKKPSDYKITPGEIKLAEQLLKAMTKPWKPAEYVDEYRTALLKWIESKAKRGGKKPKPAAADEAELEPTIINLMDVLKQSVKERGGGTKAGASKRPAARKPLKRKRA